MGPSGKNIRVFPLETLKNFILNEPFYPYMTSIRVFFLQIRKIFSNFWKRAGETSPPSPPLVTRLYLWDFQASCQHWCLNIKNFLVIQPSPFLRIQWRFIFSNVIRCYRLRLWVGYFIYFKFTHVFFWFIFLMDVLYFN